MVFDTVLGLPVHALVVHGVVVLLPLMAIVTAVVACVPRWRARAAWPVVVVDAGMVAMTLVARQSGEALQRVTRVLTRSGRASSPAPTRNSRMPLPFLVSGLGRASAKQPTQRVQPRRSGGACTT